MSNLALLAEKKHRIQRERLGPSRQPIGPLAEHLRQLLAAGWTRLEIAEQSGVNRRTLYGVLTGRLSFVNRHTATAILAVRPEELPTRILPTGTMRRLQGLSAVGWTIRQTAHDTGLHEQFLRDVLGGRYRRISRPQADAVKRVCRARYLTPGPSRTARTVAAKRGWVPVTAWEDIDDPACRPDTGQAAA